MIELHIHHHFPDAPAERPGSYLSAEMQRILAVVTRIDAATKQLLRETNHMSSEIDALADGVTQANSVMESAVTLIEGLVARYEQAGTDPEKIAEVTQSLRAETDKLAAAVKANTIASDEPDPAAEPTPDQPAPDDQTA